MRCRLKRTELETIGGRIRNARQENDMRILDLAQAIKCSYTYMGMIERNERIPSDIRLQKIANALDVDYEWLKTGNDPNTVINPLESWLSIQGERVTALIRELKHTQCNNQNRANGAINVKGRKRKAPLPCPGRMERALRGIPPGSARDNMILEAANTILESMRETIMTEILLLIQSARLELENMAPELPDTRSLLNECVADLARQKGQNWNPAQAAIDVSASMIQITADCAAVIDAEEDPDGHAASAKKMTGEAYQWLAWLL